MDQGVSGCVQLTGGDNLIGLFYEMMIDIVLRLLSKSSFVNICLLFPPLFPDVSVPENLM